MGVLNFMHKKIMLNISNILTLPEFKENFMLRIFTPSQKNAYGELEEKSFIDKPVSGSVSWQKQRLNIANNGQETRCDIIFVIKTKEAVSGVKIGTVSAPGDQIIYKDIIYNVLEYNDTTGHGFVAAKCVRQENQADIAGGTQTEYGVDKWGNIIDG